MIQPDSRRGAGKQLATRMVVFLFEGAEPSSSANACYGLLDLFSTFLMTGWAAMPAPILRVVPKNPLRVIFFSSFCLFTVSFFKKYFFIEVNYVSLYYLYFFDAPMLDMKYRALVLCTGIVYYMTSAVNNKIIKIHNKRMNEAGLSWEDMFFFRRRKYLLTGFWNAFHRLY